MSRCKLIITIATLLFIALSISDISKAASNDTSLKSISIEPSGYELVQDENDNKIYRVKVDNSVTSVKVNAVPNNKDTNITVSGNNELSVGTNKVNVNVTAKNGDQSIYTIYVRRSSAPLVQEHVIPNVQDDYNEEQNENAEASNDNAVIKAEENKENNENKNEQAEENNENNIEESNTETNNASDNIDKVKSIKNKITNLSKKKMIIFIVTFTILIIIIVCFIIKKAPKGKHS